MFWKRRLSKLPDSWRFLQTTTPILMMTGQTPRSSFSNIPNSEAVQIDPEQMFHLIDGILPFEACLYHQVLPLRLEGSRLHLGMVDPEDALALDYVRRILAYLNCSLIPEAITAKTHQAMLSAYLCQTGKQQQPSRPTARLKSPPADETAAPDRQSSPTLIVDSPDKLESLDFPTVSQTETLVEEEVEAPEKSNLAAPTQIPESIELPPVAPTAMVLPQLEVQARYLSSPVEELVKLPPAELLQELFGRVLVGGIGRLYFERHQDKGRILWSLNGVLQSVLDGLSPQVFQGVINELKRLTHMPMLPVQKPKQVEIERRYEQTRLLLRLRVMPGKYGEEATLQVLRGAALKFYQQQQFATLGRDALGIAQQLQKKLGEIRDRVRTNPTLSSEQLDALPALNQVLKDLEGQLKDLEALREQREHEQ